MTRKQCAKCPWKVSTDPFDIPGGYSVERHKALEDTETSDNLFERSLHMMACHESPIGAELPCVGWLANQLGPGGNLALRLRVTLGEVDADIELDGLQHVCLRDTLPPGAT